MSGKGKKRKRKTQKLSETCIGDWIKTSTEGNLKPITNEQLQLPGFFQTYIVDPFSEYCEIHPAHNGEMQRLSMEWKMFRFCKCRNIIGEIHPKKWKYKCECKGINAAGVRTMDCTCMPIWHKNAPGEASEYLVQFILNHQVIAKSIKQTLTQAKHLVTKSLKMVCDCNNNNIESYSSDPYEALDIGFVPTGRRS